MEGEGETVKGEMKGRGTKGRRGSVDGGGGGGGGGRSASFKPQNPQMVTNTYPPPTNAPQVPPAHN